MSFSNINKLYSADYKYLIKVIIFVPGQLQKLTKSLAFNTLPISAEKATVTVISKITYKLAKPKAHLPLKITSLPYSFIKIGAIKRKSYENETILILNTS